MDPKDKLENGVYVLKSAARPWMVIQIGDVVDPVTKARKITVEKMDDSENNKAQQWRSTYQGIGENGYGLYTLQSEGKGFVGYYLNTAHDIEAKPVRGELSQGQDLKWWSGCYEGISELRIFLVGEIPVSNALSYVGDEQIGIESIPPPPPGAKDGNWGEIRNLWTPVKITKPECKDMLENGVYFLTSAAMPLMSIQVGDIVDPVTKARKISLEKTDKNNKAQHWRSTYECIGDYGYGLYTFQSQGEGLTDYYLDTNHVVEAAPVQGELDRGQNLKWWSACKDGHTDLRIFLVDGIIGIPVSNALSCVGSRGTEIGIVSLPSPPPGAVGGNWGAVLNLWTPVKVSA